MPYPEINEDRYSESLLQGANGGLALQLPERLLALLEHHIGQGSRIGAAEIARVLGCALALVPALVNALRLAGIAICGDQAAGYFVAGSAEELAQTCRAMHETALQALLLEAQMRGAPLGELLARISCELAAIDGLFNTR